MNKTELYWLLGTLGFVLIFILLLFGWNGLDPFETVDINIYDTYFLIDNFRFTTPIFAFTFFGVYLLRVIRSSFKNFTLNVILIIANIIMLLALDIFSYMLDMFSQGYETSEFGSLIPDKHPIQKFLSIFSDVLRGIQTVLLVFLAYCGFRTGRSYRSQVDN